MMWLMAIFVAIAVVIGGTETFFRLKPLVFGPPEPVTADTAGARVSRRVDPSTGLAETWYRFDGEVREVCGQQTFQRQLVDLRHDEVKAPTILQAPGSPNQYFAMWLPRGRHKDIVTVVREEPGRVGNIILLLAADQCPSGYEGTQLIYQLRFDWTSPPRPEDQESRPIREVFP